MNNDDLAKPHGITLKEHTNNVMNEAKCIIQFHPFVMQKYSRLTGKSLKKRLVAAAYYHDDGKKHKKWQQACKKDYDEYKKNGKVLGIHLRTTGLRHEMESLRLHANDIQSFSDVLKIAIAAHHGKLSERFAERWEKDEKGVYQTLWEDFKKYHLTLIVSDIKPVEKFKEAVLKNYEFAGPRDYLQLADHRASTVEENKPTIDFKKFNYDFNPTWQKWPVQHIAEDNWEEGLLLLRAPTGAGKTDACLLWANKQIENGRADRLVIAMPTRFTSNALAINVASSLSETGLYHSSAWFVRHFENAKKSLDEEHKAKAAHEFARLLETSVTVCTIDHLLISLTHSREDHHSITFNLAHSCLVIDEADFYDEFTQANIIQLLKVLKILQVPVLLMSASLPETSLELFQTTGFQPKEIKEDISDNQRIRCEVKGITKYESASELEIILEKAKKQPTIIYANTVAKAMEFYNWFKGKEIKPILYHSRFTEPHKAQKENKLLENLGKEAWKNNQANGIAILTQIGEMSVNVSADFMISDICPIDRLVQRIGRLSRFNKKIGELEILIPHKKDAIYPAPYGNYIPKQGWKISDTLEKTISLLKCKQYNAFDFVLLVNEVYKELQEFSNRTILNAEKLRDQIIQNWLILPKAMTEEDAEGTHIWKSRDIEAQVDVFVLDPYDYLEKNRQKFAGLEKNKNKDCFFDNYKEFMYFKNQYNVSCPQYLFQKAIRNGKIYHRNKIWIGDSNEPKSIWCTSYYDSDLGLIFDDNDNFP